VGLDVPEVSQRSYRLWLEILLGSEADLVVVNVEDLWLEEQPQNVPGSLERPNWRSMLSCDITSLPPEVLEALASIVRPA
jgi:4-alpha-glucanotransferase